MNLMRKASLIILLIFTFLILLSGCGAIGAGSSGREYTVTVSWAENPEKLVNSKGGGYRVYYSKKAGFTLNDTEIRMVDIPYVSEPKAPTSVDLLLEKGTWHVKVVAYLNLQGESTSLPSEEIVYFYHSNSFYILFYCGCFRTRKEFSAGEELCWGRNNYKVQGPSFRYTDVEHT